VFLGGRSEHGVGKIPGKLRREDVVDFWEAYTCGGVVKVGVAHMERGWDKRSRPESTSAQPLALSPRSPRIDSPSSEGEKPQQQGPAIAHIDPKWWVQLVGFCTVTARPPLTIRQPPLRTNDPGQTSSHYTGENPKSLAEMMRVSTTGTWTRPSSWLVARLSSSILKVEYGAHRPVFSLQSTQHS